MSKNIAELKGKLKEDPDNLSVLEKYLGALSDAIFDYADDENIDAIENINQEIQEIAVKYPEVPSALMTYGQITLNSLPVIFAYKQLIDVKKIINSFRSKVDELKNIKLVEILAMILVNAIYDFSIKNHVSSITEYALELTDLTREYPKNEKIQVAGAKGMMNATMYFLQNRDITAAKNYYKVLMKILDASSDKEIVDSRQLSQLKDYFGE